MTSWRFILSIVSLFSASSLLEDAGASPARPDSDNMSLPTVYVLKCKDGAFYVGYSANFDARMGEHASEFGGSEWTREHKPLEVVERHEVANEDEGKALEKRLTLQHMMDYGVNKVRGAGYTHTRAYASSGLEAIVRSYAEAYDEDVDTVRDRFESALPLHYPDEFGGDTEHKAASLSDQSGEDEGAGYACASGGDAEASVRSFSDEEELDPREPEASKDETDGAIPAQLVAAEAEAEASHDGGAASEQVDDPNIAEASDDIVEEHDYIEDQGGDGFDGGYDDGGYGFDDSYDGGYDSGRYDDEY